MRIPTLEYFEWQRGVIAIQNNPPESPSRGDSYIVGVGTGGWAGHNDNIAIYDVSGWTFIAPVNGMFCYNKSDGYLYEYKTSWDKAANLQNLDYLKKDGSRAITDNWNVDGSDTLFIDKTNGRVGIKTASPQEDLDVNGFVNTKSIHKVSDEGLVLAMNFNSENIFGTAGSEKVLDSSGYNNHGVNNGATFNKSGGFNGSGAFSFDGDNDYIDCGHNASLNITDAITIEYWIYRIGNNAHSYTEDTVGKRSGGCKYMSGGTRTRNLTGSIGGVADRVLVTAISFSNNVWTHFVFTYDSSTKIGKGYKNGVLTTTRDVEAAYPDLSSYELDAFPDVPVRISSNTVYQVNGLIDGVRIYNRAISDDEVKANYLQRAECHNSFVSQKDIYVDASGNPEIFGILKSGGYKSSDGSAGITKTIEIKDYDNKTHTLTFKNGILTAHTYA